MMVLKDFCKSALIPNLKVEISLAMIILGHGMLVWVGTWQN